MEPSLERRLARIEVKISILARWFVLMLGIAVAFAGNLLFRESDWALFYGVGLGFLAGFAFERAVAGLEKRLPDVDEDDGGNDA